MADAAEASGDEFESDERRRPREGDESDDEPPTLGDLLDELDEYEESLTDPARRERMQEIIETATEVEEPAVFGRTIVGFDRADLVEATLGALLFGIPMMVEGGTQEVGAFVATRPVYLVGTLAFAVATTVGILYVAEFQDVRIYKPLLGFLPRRLVGVLGVSLLLSLAMSTVWGRVDWANPWLAFCTCAVAFVPMAIGSALGDILPGS
ncbi:DUF2391 family protein [Halorientalis pallida]|uniref:DUF2391 family protein n=1 Tax=Halorientalis pallida TaxID=2479928 RepID=A0A498KRH7_9EURY|nr:DUF2391 family protein [Halorientalis pallida]RXK46717.1 DUF2391 family protein [Halorientalis pallida]